MENEKLLPCPFCGGSAEYRNDGMTGYVQCQNCLARTDGVYSWRDEHWKEDVAREWNTRVFPKEVQEAIEKQTSKKPKKDIVHYRCPNCDAMLSTYYMHICCEYCGQKLDWSD